MDPSQLPRNWISLFSGGGGLDLGVSMVVPRARTVAYVERDGYPAATLVARMEEGSLAPAPVHTDVLGFDGRPFRGKVGGIVGGFPCQDISAAGKREGITGSRSGLWSEFARIIRDVGPEWVFVENVSALLVRGLDVVLGDLVQLGFDAEWEMLRASDVGAPHQRARLFLLAHANGSRVRQLAERGQRGQRGQPPAQRRNPELVNAGEGRPVANHTLDGREKGSKGQVFQGDKPQPDECGDLVADAEGPRVGRVPGRRSVGGEAPDAGRDGQRAVEHAAELGLGPQPRVDVREREHAVARAGLAVVDTHHAGRGEQRGAVATRAEQPAAQRPDRPIRDWPPGPGDAEGWKRYLERWPDAQPGIRRSPDGVAQKLDPPVSMRGCLHYRVERLRMLGNGVVPSQAAQALRDLAGRY